MLFYGSVRNNVRVLIGNGSVLFLLSPWNSRRRCEFIPLLLLLILPWVNAAIPSYAQTTGMQLIHINGVVRDSTGRPVADATVYMAEEDRGASTGNSTGTNTIQTKTDVNGNFAISAPHAGAYTLRITKDGFRGRAEGPIAFSAGDRKHFIFALDSAGAAAGNSKPSTSSRSSAMEFADKPNFTVAGITDWTAVGGHGADTNLRASEALAKETVALNADTVSRSYVSSPHGASENQLKTALTRDPQSFNANHELGEFYLGSQRYAEAIPLLESANRLRPDDYSTRYDLALAYKGEGDLVRARKDVNAMLGTADKAELHHLLGDIDEGLNDPLGAEREYERAVRLDPAEDNYFRWATELLLHRAIEPAAEVFADGAKLYPRSARMLSGLGAALYASGAYDEGAMKVCAASDLSPSDTDPYIFLGQMEVAAPAPLPCVEQRLARFAREHPENAMANYYYAMAIWKKQPVPAGPAALGEVKARLEKSVTTDPTFADGHLQLGILYSAEGDLDRAVSAFREAIAHDPSGGEAHYRLAMIYQRMGNNAKAQDEFRLHDECAKNDAAAVERQRREIQQFMIVLKDQQPSSSRH